MEHVLLTGLPGYLAESLIGRCRQADAPVFWHLIVLPDQLTQASERLRALGLGVSEYAIYPGDITKPDLGLSPQDARKLQIQIERCFHLAALYDLTAPASDVGPPNVRGTRRVVQFLTKCSRLKKFNYVSTCYISGTRAGDIAEDALPDPPKFHNAYEQTKHEAERVVRAHLDRLPTTIFRPVVVVGDSQTGETSKFDGPYALIQFLKWARHVFRWLPNIGFADVRFNCVPVDFATAVLCDVGLSDDFVGKTLQLADPNAPTTAEGFAAIYRQVTGRECFNPSDRFRRFVLWLLGRFPIGVIAGVSAPALQYFRHPGVYRTDNLQAACVRFDIEIPEWADFYKPMIKFGLTERRQAPNAGVIRTFKRWCFAFRFIYAFVGLVFLAAPSQVVRLLTVLDAPERAAVLTADNLLWRPLSVSLIVTLFVAVTFLERNPFHKPLHILINGCKLVSAAIFLTYAASLGAISLLICGIIDGLIGMIHLLFYYRLSRIREMTGSEFRWDPYHLLFPERFLAGFTESMAPRLDDPVDVRLVVENVQEEVRGFPFQHRYGFILVCYAISVVLPCLCGYRPFFMMDLDGRRRFLARVQHDQAVWLKMPLMFVKLVCTAHLFAQKPYLRSIGAE